MVTITVPRDADARERMDSPLPPADLAATLDDLDRLNAWFGGYALTLRRIRRVAAALPRDARLRVLDVGGGRGDLAVNIVRWARRAGRPVRVVVVDTDTTTLALARRRTAPYPEISLVQADGGAMPVRDGGVDVAHAALTLHHLDADGAIACLAQMAAAAPTAIVNDLLRTPLTLAQVWLTTRVLNLHPVSRHDGPVSVRRAWSPEELRMLAEKAGRRARVTRYPGLGRLVAEIA